MNALTRILHSILLLFIRQPKKAGAAAAGGVMATAVIFVGGWEGLRTTAYRDPVGVVTICYGETQGVRMGETRTKAECDEMLRRRLAEFEARLASCIGTNYSRLPAYTRVAFLSHAYNVGSAASCGSTLVRKVKAGDFRGACAELPKWNKAGGRVLGGLVKRRSAESVLCYAGLDGDEFDWREVLP